MKNKWMIYGANGYSAQLAIEKAIASGLKPVLAGRNAQKIEELAESVQLPFRIFDLSDRSKIVENLHDIKIVSHCAGPYSQTADAMMRACIESKTHYTDITGEIDVFLHAQTLSDAARAAEVVIMPGVGLDIIPTDSVAGKLAQAMPDAEHLVLGIDGDMEFSPGTAKTAISVVSEGMKVFRNGKLKSVSRSFEMREIDYGNGKKGSAVVPWGDLGTATYQTGIPNVTVYMPARITTMQRLMFPVVQQFMRISAVQNYMQRRIERKVKGPNSAKRANTPTYIWGEVTNKKGDKVTCRLRTPNGYEFTGSSIVFTAKHLLNYDGQGGFFTPSQLLGIDAVESIEGVSKLTLS